MLGVQAPLIPQAIRDEYGDPVDLPRWVGLCPIHGEHFYMPLDDGKPAFCPECPAEMVLYERSPGTVGADMNTRDASARSDQRAVYLRVTGWAHSRGGEPRWWEADDGWHARVDLPDGRMWEMVDVDQHSAVAWLLDQLEACS
jgi:hypothetical protein